MTEKVSNSLWELQKMEGKNPVHTGSFLNAFDQREFTADEVAAREGGQNALDAGRNVMGITELHFHKLKVAGENKVKLLELFQFDDLLRARLPIFEKDTRNQRFAGKVKEFLDGKALTALLIRDFKTCGLGGQWDRYEKDDHFARLVCALNLDDKAEGDSNSGGSFGLGKTTYAKSSLINTVLYHSVFEATDDTKGTNRRLMVAGVYPRHEFEGVKYGGFAYYGEPTSEDPNLTKPFEDQAAEELWAKVQDLFEVDAPRTETQTGTDILILMDCLDLEALKKAVEDYYFPALIRNELSVTFHDEDGFRSTPKVLDREDLDQFIKLYKHAKDCEKERSEGFEAAALNKLNDHNLGCFAFQSAEPDEAASKKNNCVALMRGTGMVVNYVKFGSDQYEPAVGVFVAHDDIWKYLIASENAAHSEWNDMQRRLDENYPKLGPQIVKAVNDRVKKRFESFQHQLQPDVSVSRTESGLLARLLSGALSGSKGDKGPVKNFHNPVGIHLKQKKREENRSVWRLQIHENEHTPQASFPLALYPSISIAGEKWVALKHRDFKIKDLKGKILKNESQPELNFTFSKGETIDLLVELGNPGRQNYVVQCKCVADIPEESE